MIRTAMTRNIGTRRTTNVTLPKVSVLKVDKDCYVTRGWITDWARLVVVPVCGRFGVKVEEIHKTNSRKGVHFYIRISPSVHAELANRLQWLLGDDCRRVDFNRARIEVRYAAWNELFEREKPTFSLIYPPRINGGV